MLLRTSCTLIVYGQQHEMIDRNQEWNTAFSNYKRTLRSCYFKEMRQFS